MRKSYKVFFISIVLVGPIIALNALAEPPSKEARESKLGLNVSGLIGGAFQNLSAGTINPSSSNTNLMYGGRVGYSIDPTWEVGVAFTTGSLNNKTLTGGFLAVSNTLSLIVADLNYHFARDLSPLYFGMRAGLAMESFAATGSPNSITNNSAAFGAQVGYDFIIVNGFSVGPRVAYTYILSPSSTNALSDLYGGIHDIEAMATIKYSF